MCTFDLMYYVDGEQPMTTTFVYSIDPRIIDQIGLITNTTTEKAFANGRTYLIS